MNRKTTHIINAISLLIAIAFLFTATSCNPTKRVGEEEYWLYRQNIHIDNPEISKKKIRKYLRQKPNRLMFGMAVPVYFYNSIDPEKEKRREAKRAPKDLKRNKKRQAKGKEEKSRLYLSRWLLKIGEPIAIFDEFEHYKSKENILDYLKTKGYYYSTVEDSFEIQDKKMWLTYVISTDNPYTIDSFYFDIENKDISNIMENDSINLTLKRGVVFDSDLLKAERLRITKLLKSKSYFLFKKEYIRYFADTNQLKKTVKLRLSVLNPNNYDARIASNHKKFKINDIHIYLGYDPREDLLLETDYLKTFESLKFGNIIFHYKGKSVIDPNVILRGLYIKGNSFYNFSDVEKTYKYLTNLHTFKLININFKNTTEGGFIRDTEKTYGKLDCIIKLTTTTKQSYTAETELNISSYGDYGAAANIGYKNLNLWRKAITLEVNTKAAREIIYIQTENGRELFKVNIIGGEFDFLFPRLLTPIDLGKFDAKYKPKTFLNVNVDYQERFDYTNLISTFSYGYKWKTNINSSHFISLAEFSTAKVFNIRDEYVDFVFENDIWSSFFDNILLGINYKYLFTNHNPTIYDNSYFFRYGIEFSGNLLAAASSLLNFKKVQILYSELYANSVFDLPYFQFAKIDVEYRKYLLLQNGSQLVLRGFLGVGLPYGNLKFMPMQKQYYSGGANSIRAWPPKRLGPGSLDVEDVLTDDVSISYNNLFQNSDMKLEFNIEHRFKMFWKLDGAFFIDAGNIWSLSDSKFKEDAYFKWNKFYKDIAVGAGAGVRLNFGFFVARFDLGIRILDPVLQGSKWAWKSGNNTDENFNFNFGIGYPF